MHIRNKFLAFFSIYLYINIAHIYFAHRKPDITYVSYSTYITLMSVKIFIFSNSVKRF